MVMCANKGCTNIAQMALLGRKVCPPCYDAWCRLPKKKTNPRLKRFIAEKIKDLTPLRK